MPYSFYDIAWLFLLYSFLGWCCEVVFCSVGTGKFVNRGFLNGPVCPVYGFGATSVVLLLNHWADNIFLVFVLGALITSTFEFIAGFLLEKLFHTRWWDYTDRPFNLHGYVCLQFSLMWGIACILLMKVLQPGVYQFILFIPHTLGIILLIVLYLLLLCDLVTTVVAVGKLNKNLGEISRIGESLRRGSTAVAEGLGNTAIAVADAVTEKANELGLEEKKQALAKDIKDKKNEYDVSLTELQAKMKKAKEEYTSRIETLFNSKNRIQHRLIRAFPHMENLRYQEAFKDLKNKYLSNKTKASLSNSIKKEDKENK